MKTLILSLIILLLLGAGCQAVNPTIPTDIPFPTMTVGQQVEGRLPTAGPRSLNIGIQATAAISNRTTPTPDTSRCPFANPAAILGEFPSSRVDAISVLLQFLNDGGTAQRLQETILSQWNAFGETGYLETLDLTGEGSPEIILGYIAPGDVGTLLIFGCQAGRYVQLYEAISDGLEAPQILALENINNVAPNDLVFSRRRCTDAETCEFQTQIIAWEFRLGRFVNLLVENLLTLELPQLRDIDNDQVQEIVIELESNGTAATGPLRTGVNIYDWNGQLYVLFSIQLDPPRYRIQVIHEGDRAFSHLNMPAAIQAYRLALDLDQDLRYWFNDGPINDISYGQYRLILANAYMRDSAGIINTRDAMNEQFPREEGEELEDLPVYVHMANVFVDNLVQNGDLHNACAAVQEVISERPEALQLINRYGSRSPNYSALELCPY
jgi:hypothetical protein